MSLTFELGKNSFRTLVPEHYSEIRGLGLMECFSETGQKFVIFLEYKNLFFILCYFLFPNDYNHKASTSYFWGVWMKNSKELMFRKVIKFQNFYYRFHKWELLEFSQLNSKVNTYTNSNFGRPIWRQITNLMACSRATCGMYSLNYVNNLQTNQANVSTNRIGTGLYA